MQPTIGKIYQVKEESKEKCSNFKDVGVKIKVTNIDEYLYYDILDATEKKVVSCCVCFSKSDLVLKKDFNSLDIGDQVEKDGDKRTVLSILPSNPENMVYVLSGTGNQKHIGKFSCFSAQEMIDNGYKIVGETEEEEVKELTVADVEKLVGGKVKIIK